MPGFSRLGFAWPVVAAVAAAAGGPRSARPCGPFSTPLPTCGSACAAEDRGGQGGSPDRTEREPSASQKSSLVIPRLSRNNSAKPELATRVHVRLKGVDEQAVLVPQLTVVVTAHSSYLLQVSHEPEYDRPRMPL
jgi:hypothetical protein